MALQRHPIDSFEKKVNFWEEFSDYKMNRIFGVFWECNKNAGPRYLEASSNFMWLLTVCYDRKSSFFAQPEKDKWEVAGDNIFGQASLMTDLLEDMTSKPGLLKFADLGLVEYIAEFEKTIDTPIGLSLRILEKKLAQRTAFINATDYTMDYYEVTGAKNVLRKGTADQLDRMFANTEKINSLVIRAMEDLKTVEGHGVAKGGGKESLSDGDKKF
jgi:hypothetical protein